jgi:hypothetical protein
MKVTTIFKTMLMMFVFVQIGTAGQKDGIQKYFNDTAHKVKATDDAVQKRDILNRSLQTMSNALDQVENSGLISQEERPAVNRFKAALQEKNDELMGSNGFERVPDTQLNVFSDFVVQDMEQADKTITISVVTALLIVIIIILLT